MRPLPIFLFVTALVVGACGQQVPPGSPSTPAATPPSAAMSSSPVPAGPLPIVIDTDMGMDDLLALYVLLREPSVDVRAIAIDGTGLVHCGAGNRNLRRILGAFDRLDIPFGCGRETPGPNGRLFPDEWRASSDDMYGVVLPPVAASEFPPDAVTVLRDAVATSAAPVTVVALGPWTNLQDLFAADPGSRSKVAGIHAMAGTMDAPGNIELGGTTPADKVEWNVGADPDAFNAVLALDVPVTLVPLDATNDVPVPFDILAILDADHAAAGADIAFETYARSPGLHGEGSYWWDGTAAVGLVDESLLTWEDATVTVIGEGAAAGRIDRDPAGRPTRIALGAEGPRVTDAILEGLRRGAPRPEPFTTSGTVRVSWDGASCSLEGAPPAQAGLMRVELANGSSAPVGLVGVGVRPPRTWADLLDFLGGLDLSDEDPVIPDWVIEIDGSGPNAEAGQEEVALVTLPAGLVGLLCLTGEWPDITFVDGGSFVLEE